LAAPCECKDIDVQIRRTTIESRIALTNATAHPMLDDRMPSGYGLFMMILQF